MGVNTEASQSEARVDDIRAHYFFDSARSRVDETPVLFSVTVSVGLSRFEFELHHEPNFKVGDKIPFQPSWLRSAGSDPICSDVYGDLLAYGTIGIGDDGRSVEYEPLSSTEALRASYLIAISEQMSLCGMLQIVDEAVWLGEIKKHAEPRPAYALGKLMSEYLWKFNYESDALVGREIRYQRKIGRQEAALVRREIGQKSLAAVQRCAERAVQANPELGGNISQLAREIVRSPNPPIRYGRTPSKLSWSRVKTLLEELKLKKLSPFSS